MQKKKKFRHEHTKNRAPAFLIIETAQKRMPMDNITHEAPSPREETLKLLRAFARAYRPAPRQTAIGYPNAQAAVPQLSNALPC